MSKKKEKWYLYIIEDKNGSYYTGITKDVGRRFIEHQSQGKKCAKSLRGKIPLRLVFTQTMKSIGEALSLEHKIKKMSKAKKEEIITRGRREAKSPFLRVVAQRI